MNDWLKIAMNWIGVLAAIGALGCFAFIVYVGVVLLNTAKTVH